MRSAIRILVILGASAGAGAASRVFRFPEVPWIPDASKDIRVDHDRLKEIEISLEQFKDFIAQAEAGGSVLIIDARMPEEFAKAHVAAASILNVPEDPVSDYPRHIQRLQAFDGWTLVLYCTSRTCDAAEKVFNALDAAGFSGMKIYKDGWEGWVSAKGPSATGGERIMNEPAELWGTADAAMPGDEAHAAEDLDEGGDHAHENPDDSAPEPDKPDEGGR